MISATTACTCSCGGTGISCCHSERCCTSQSTPGCTHHSMLRQQRPRPCSTHGCSAASLARLPLRVVARQLDDPQHSINVRNLTLSLGPPGRERRILNGVDLTVRRGSLHMLLGPNGCGKSTLLKVLGGLIPSYEGSVATDQPTGFVFQNPDHQVVMPTVAADVAFGLGRYKLPEAQVASAVDSALDLVNLRDYMHRATHTLSGGQRQRVAIAGALAEGPRLLLLDELTTFLDVEDQFGVLRAVRSITHQRSDVTAIWVTHRFEELQYADAASYMDAGRVVVSGPVEQLKAHLRAAGAVV